MASDNPWKRLQEEATCTICWKYYVDPCILDCGHSFCQACVSQCWKAFPDKCTACPKCGTVVERMNSCPNTPLTKVVEIAKQLSNQVKGQGKGKLVCEKHPEPSRIVFCLGDQILFCQICEGSEQHREHQVASVEETAQRYKDLYFRHIVALKEQRAELMKRKFNIIQWEELLKKNCIAIRQTAAAVFKQLRDLLENHENHLLMRLQSVFREINEKRNQNDLGRLALEIFTLETNIRQLEEKASQPVHEFLLDAMETIDRCRRKASLPILEDALLDMKWRFWEVGEMSAMLGGLTNFFRDTLQKTVSMTRVNVTLDPASNHPRLLVTPDGTGMQWQPTALPLPKSNQRFNTLCCALGWQRFTIGHYLWEVFVQGPGDWAVGVAKLSVKRKGNFRLCPMEGVFAVGKLDQRYRVINTMNLPILLLDGELRWIRVSLNCSTGEVNFYDVPRAMKIYGFTGTGCLEESLLPFFWLNGEGQLTILNH